MLLLWISGIWMWWVPFITKRWKAARTQKAAAVLIWLGHPAMWV
jgi:hypothetical protein